MTTITQKIRPFEEATEAYDNWFERHPEVFQSEVEALRSALPEGDSHGIEIGLGTGRFASALGIKEGIEPSPSMRAFAVDRGIEVMDATAERLPYKAMHFDFVLMASCISYLENIDKALREANRVLKPAGRIIIGMIEQNSAIGKYYESRRKQNSFYKDAVFYSLPQLINKLRNAGFNDLHFTQTLFGELEEINHFQRAEDGWGKGSYIVIQAFKK